MEISPIPSARIGESPSAPAQARPHRQRRHEGDRAPIPHRVRLGRARTAPRDLARDRPRPPLRSGPRRGPRGGFPDGISIRADGPSTGRGRAPSRAGLPGRSARARVRLPPVATWSWRGRTTQSDRWRRGSVPGFLARDRARTPRARVRNGSAPPRNRRPGSRRAQGRGARRRLRRSDPSPRPPSESSTPAPAQTAIRRARRPGSIQSAPPRSAP